MEFFGLIKLNTELGTSLQFKNIARTSIKIVAFRQIFLGIHYKGWRKCKGIMMVMMFILMLESDTTMLDTKTTIGLHSTVSAL